MKPIKNAALVLCLGTIAVFPVAAGADEAQSVGAVEAISIAVDAYIYGYPLVTFDMVRRQQTNVATPDAEHAQIGHLIKMRTYPAVVNHCCAAPNADTLYTEVYVVRFEKGQLPPAEAFWSLTMYDTDFFFVPNPINRYDLAPRDRLITDPDGSVNLYLQAESPGKAKEANWLPAPRGKFALVTRIYSPTTTPPSILDGTWTPPAVTLVQ